MEQQQQLAIVRSKYTGFILVYLSATNFWCALSCRMIANISHCSLFFFLSFSHCCVIYSGPQILERHFYLSYWILLSRVHFCMFKFMDYFVFPTTVIWTHPNSIWMIAFFFPCNKKQKEQHTELQNKPSSQVVHDLQEPTALL